MAKKPQYTKRDYELVASVLKVARETVEGDAAHTAVGYVMVLFASQFQADNSSFDAERFAKACTPAKDPLY